MMEIIPLLKSTFASVMGKAPNKNQVIVVSQDIVEVI